jgi:hypothetical protein
MFSVAAYNTQIEMKNKEDWQSVLICERKKEVFHDSKWLLLFYLQAWKHFFFIQSIELIWAHVRFELRNN